MQPNELDPGLRAEIEATATMADKIRLLDRRGIPRAEIARILQRRYQHVRNVLERDRARLNAQAARGDAPQASVRLVVGPDGQITLPPALVDAIGLDGRRTVTARVEDGELHVISPRVALRRAQALVRGFDTGEGSPVDELLRERRAEAARG